jgi:hypothetical protein
MATEKRVSKQLATRTPTTAEKPNLLPGLNSATLAAKLNQRAEMINAVIERKERSQIVTQEVMLLEFHF